MMIFPIQTDGTTNLGSTMQHNYDIQIPNSNTTYSLDLRHVFSGAAHDTLETLKQILSGMYSV